MSFSSLFVLFASIASTQAALNGPCTGGGLASGVGICISTSSCQASGGTIYNNLCPDDPEDIKCCTKAPCTSAIGGVCRFTSTCSINNHYMISGRLIPPPKSLRID
ncbi:putative d-alanyl-d-alanine carboxypeptidase protein [Mycena sanguinolenta]|uniref:Putative d-alanyl-d-alanine carboxypeptidase protein n=1 Tax=Mycena sanguinolenta TaxID=230812 RepID=A0A8H6YGY4_9AGAR|nr:putative d-alanyl-d-alanine carboxypeptidase protein [Mycena sanguinolenta]